MLNKDKRKTVWDVVRFVYILMLSRVTERKFVFHFLVRLKLGNVTNTEWRWNTSRFIETCISICVTISPHETWEHFLPPSFKKNVCEVSDTILMSSTVAIPYRLKIIVANMAMKLDSLNPMPLMESWGCRGQWKHLITRDKMYVVTIRDNRAIIVIKGIWPTEIFGLG